MREPEHEPNARTMPARGTRTRAILALLLLLATVAALLPACGGEHASSHRAGASGPSPDPSASPWVPPEAAGSTRPARRGAAGAPGAGERFGMDPAGTPGQGAPASPPTEQPANERNGLAAPPASPPHPTPGPKDPSAPSEPSRPDAHEHTPPAAPADENVAEDAQPPGAAQAPGGQEEAVPVPENAPPKEPPRPESPAPAEPAKAQTPQVQASDAIPAAAPAATMYLTVPALGLDRAPVLDDSSKEAMDQGVIHIPGTNFPWLPSGKEGSNTYLAAHRIGYPGTGSDRVFHDLPALSLGDEVILTDSNGAAYPYKVSEATEVSPYDTWVANPIPGRDVVTLQTCIEDFGDLWTEGPDWNARYVVRADRAF